MHVCMTVVIAIRSNSYKCVHMLLPFEMLMNFEALASQYDVQGG